MLILQAQSPSKTSSQEQQENGTVSNSLRSFIGPEHIKMKRIPSVGIEPTTTRLRVVRSTD